MLSCHSPVFFSECVHIYIYIYTHVYIFRLTSYLIYIVTVCAIIGEGAPAAGASPFQQSVPTLTVVIEYIFSPLPERRHVPDRLF